MRYLLLIFSLLPFSVFSSGWNCTNKGIEVQCDKDSCSSSTSFTPLSISADNKKLSVCAYTGCWEGKSTVIKQGHYIIYTGNHLAWTHNKNSKDNFILVINTKENPGLLKGGGFAMPVYCSH